MDMIFLKFYGLAMRCSEEDMGITLAGDDSKSFVEGLHQISLEIGLSEKKKRPWLLDRFRDSFLHASEPPKFIESLPAEWPFFQGKPMVFISQHQIPATETARRLLAPGRMVYLFGARKPYLDSYMMTYATIEQVDEL